MSLTSNGIYRFNRLLAEQYGKSKIVFYLYTALRLFTIVLMVICAAKGYWLKSAQCFMALFFYWTPAIWERKHDTDFPPVFEVIILLFITAFFTVGEVFNFMGTVSWWDTMLHTLYGFIFTAFFFSFLEIYTKDKELKFKVSPFYSCCSAAGMTMLFGTFWEYFEFFADQVLKKDMQKDRLVDHFSTTFFDDTNVPVQINNITSTVINVKDGDPITLNGYLDIGILDTMKDSLVAFAGVVVFCIFLILFLKSKGKNKVAATLVPGYRDWKEEPAETQAALAKWFINLGNRKTGSNDG